MPPVLFTGKFHGVDTPLVADGDKAGNFWLLNSQTGAVVSQIPVSVQFNQNSGAFHQRQLRLPEHQWRCGVQWRLV